MRKNQKNFLITEYLFGYDIGLNRLILPGSVNCWFRSVNIGRDWLNVGRNWLLL